MTPDRLQLDYVAPSRLPWWPGIAVLGIALAAAGMLVERYREASVELESIHARQSFVGGERRPARAVPRERLEDEAKSAEAVLRQLALPWGAIIETMEEAATQDVAILQMQPDAQLKQLRVGAEARNAEAMLEYLRRLETAKALRDVHILSHQVQTEDPRRPVQFTVQASMRGAL